MSGEMASLTSGLIQRTRQPAEEKEWQRTPEKKAEQENLKQFSKIGIPAASYGALSPAFKAYPILIVGCVIACIPFPYLAP